MIRTRDDAAASRDAASRRILAAAGLLLLAGTPVIAAEKSIRAEGIASFYGREHHGGPTASGERFDMRALTAAHRTAPLGSRLKVTNLKNGKSVVVRVNDRGPFVRGRIIDLSRGAAEVLGFTGAGLTRVAVENTDAAPMRVAALEPDTTGSSSAKGDGRSSDGKPAISEAERLMIDRSAGNDH